MTDWAARVGAWRERAGRVASGPAGRWISAVVVVALVVASVLAVRSLPEGVRSLRWGPLVLLVLLGLPGLALNGLEYQLTTRLAGVPTSFPSALRVAVYGTAANLLPLPGASAVRVGAMHSTGARLGRATAMTAAVGVAWIGVSLLGPGLLLAGDGVAWVVFLAGAVAATAVAGELIRRAEPRPLRHVAVDLAQVLALEAVLVLLQAVRLAAALAALGIRWDATAALTLASAASLAAAVGILPGGLGVREAIAGVLAPLIGLSAGDALVATVFDRAASLAVVALAAAVVLRVQLPGGTALRSRRRGGAAPGPGPEEQPS